MLVMCFKAMFHENMSTGSKCIDRRPTAIHYEIMRVGYNLI
jgi:hypothetical protein